MVHWLIAIPIPKNQSKQQLSESVGKKLKAVSVPATPFDIPALRKGSQDSLYSLMDELFKYDTSIEGSLLRALKSLREVTEVEKEDDFFPEVILEDGTGHPKKKPVRDYLPEFRWDETRHMLTKELANTVEKLYRSCTKLDDDLKIKVSDFQSLKLNLQQIERKDTGTLAVKTLDGIITQDNFYESEMFITFYVVVNKDNYKEWHHTYVTIIDKYHTEMEEIELEKLKEKQIRDKELKKEREAEEKRKEKEIQSKLKGAKPDEEVKKRLEEKKLEQKKLEEEEEKKKFEESKEKKKFEGPPPVVPDSSILIKEEGDLGIFTVVVLKVMSQDFKKACDRYKYKVRDFVYDEERNKLSKMEKETLTKKRDETKKKNY